MNETDVAPPEAPSEAVIPPLKRAKPLPSGEMVIQVSEALTGLEVPPADKTALREITRDEAAGAFLRAKFGYDLELETLEARSVFSSWLERNISVGSMLLTMHLVNLEETHKLLIWAKEELNKADANGLDPDQKNALARTLLGITAEQSKMLIKAQKLAHEIAPPTDDRKPKNKPPDIVSQTNIAVYSGGGNTPERQ